MRSILGARIRERRRFMKISQAELARRIEISPSYLNLIEHNKRAIAGTLLRRVAEALELQVEEIDGAAERRLLSTLEEIAHAPDIVALGAEVDRAGELIGRYPGWARAVASLARSEREASEIARALGDRLTHDAFLGESVHRILTGIAAVRSAGEILIEHPDINRETLEKFHRIIHDECRNLTEVGEALATYFDKVDATERVLTPLDEVEALFESRGNRFEEIEAAADSLYSEVNDSTPGPRYSKAAALAQAKLGPCIDGIVANHPQVETELGQIHARDELVAYAARALLVPGQVFEPEARRLRFDIEALAELFAIDIETVCHRLSALPHEQNNVPRFGYFLSNAAGTIVRMRGLAGLVSPRYASACPLWALYRAQQSPETVIRQRALFPSGARFVFLAHARHLGPTGFGIPRHFVTDMLAMSENDAQHTVYAPDSAVPVESIGSTCRSCPRRDCLHRVSDPLTD